MLNIFYFFKAINLKRLYKVPNAFVSGIVPRLWKTDENSSFHGAYTLLEYLIQEALNQNILNI